MNNHLRYIYEHDRFRSAEVKGEKLTTFTSERNRNLALKAEKKAARERVDHLFAMLEAGNKGYKKLSYC